MNLSRRDGREVYFSGDGVTCTLGSDEALIEFRDENLSPSGEGLRVWSWCSQAILHRGPVSPTVCRRTHTETLES